MGDQSKKTWAPIVLFIFRRADHTRKTIESLMACHGFAESPIYVYADGARDEREQASVAATRAVARELLGDRATYVERETNIGLRRSVEAGITEVCDRYGKAVVVEDDLVVSPYFLQFLNEGLRRYEDEPRVMQISGYMFDVPAFRHRDEGLFLPLTTSWGWATWKRAWNLYDDDMHGWRELLSDAQERQRFDLDGRTGYSKSRLVKLVAEGGVDTWDVQWYYSVYVHDGLTLFPPRTLVVNVGLDGTGTHHRLGLPARQAKLADSPAFRFPTDIVESSEQDFVYDEIRTFIPRSRLQKARSLPHILRQRLSLART